MQLFGKKSKTPQELVRSVKDMLPKLGTILAGSHSGSQSTLNSSSSVALATSSTPAAVDSGVNPAAAAAMTQTSSPTTTTDRKALDKLEEDISKNLSAMKTILYGDKDSDPMPELVAQLAQEIYNTDLLVSLIQMIHSLEFEARKDVTQIFNNLLRRQLGSRFPTVEYICTKDAILHCLIENSQKPDVALHCGMMLRECMRHEALCKLLLQDKVAFYKLFAYVELSNFDVASDAFATFKDILTKHKSVVAEFLEENYEDFFLHYSTLLQSENYVTKRQSVKLLSELILDRSNFNIMTRFISDLENLKIIMNLLRDRSKNIQFEAFHVFKVFVANPNKPRPIIEILLKNRDKLLNYLENFGISKKDDEQLNDEKSYLVKQIQGLTFDDIDPSNSDTLNLPS